MTEGLIGEPEIMRREQQPYAAIRSLVTMDQIGDVLPGLHPEVTSWLRARGVEKAGAPFFKFNVVDMDHELEVEVGFPIASTTEADDRVGVGTLPAGNYLIGHHKGHPQELEGATAELLEWAQHQNLKFALTFSDGEERWTARLENYYSDPHIEPDMNQWETELAFLLAD